MTWIENLSRRDFLKAGAAASGSLVLGVTIVRSGRSAEPVASQSFQPNAFVRIDPDDTVTIWFGKTDMGQGIYTALPMLVAEELDIEWERVRIEQAMGHLERYGSQGTGGSNAVRSMWQPLRQAGATARAMLVTAAAARWAVPPAELETSAGAVIHRASGRRATYGSLATAAAALPVPGEVTLKDPSRFNLLGTRQRRVDTPPKVVGRATYGIDARLPGMVYATVVHPPTFGGSLRSHDATAALAVPGVRQVFAVSTGVAVVGTTTWAALQGAAAVRAEWNEGFNLDSDGIFERLQAAAASAGNAARADGDAAQAMARAARVVRGTYRVPYLAHATMEPMNCTVHLRPDGCTIWVATQSPQAVIRTAARMTGLTPDQVEVNLTFLGGGFGRRSEMDFVREAVEVAQQANAPVQVVWSRESDTRGGKYRPVALGTLEAALDQSGNVTAWTHRIVDQSIFRSKGWQLNNGIDPTGVEGAANIPYTIPSVRVEYSDVEFGVPLHFWRSVGSSQNAFITECFIDEVAFAAGRDPFEFRRDLLASAPRHRAVLEEVARRSGWGGPVPEGRARGIAVAESFGSFVAQVAEISMQGEQPRVHRVWCVVDCGMTVNPAIIEAQMESGIVYGLSAALAGQITLDQGRPVESNFHDYPVLRINQMPAIETHVMESTDPPGGVGEPGTPPIAPAVANAVFALTGRRVRTLPLTVGLREAGAQS